jgi:hypothetical protein
VPETAVRGVEEGVVEWFGNVVHWSQTLSPGLVAGPGR